MASEICELILKEHEHFTGANYLLRTELFHCLGHRWYWVGVILGIQRKQHISTPFNDPQLQPVNHNTTPMDGSEVGDIRASVGRVVKGEGGDQIEEGKGVKREA